MLDGVFCVIIFPICLNPAPLEGTPLLPVDIAPFDLLDEFKALFPAGGNTLEIFNIPGACYAYLPGTFSVNSLSNEAICTLY
jgi:hypothetical protein